MLSETLGRRGSAGTEDLACARTLPHPVIAEIRDSAGGDGVRGRCDHRRLGWDGGGDAAVATAERLAALTRERSTIDTIAGTFELAVRMGVAAGRLEVAIGGADRRLVVLTHGEAVDAAVACEARATPGQVVIELDLVDGDARSAVTSSRPSDIEPDRFAHAVTVDRSGEATPRSWTVTVR